MAAEIENKLAYVVDSLLSDHILNDHPKWKDLITVFAEYLDNNTHGKIVNILDNINYNTIYSELLDSYTDNYFKDVIDRNKYELTDENKRLFISLSKILTGTKGTKQSFDFLFKYLTDFSLDSGEGNSISIDEFTIGYEVNEDWWKPGIFNYYSGLDQASATLLHDGTYVYDFDVGQPYTYKFVTDQPRDSITSLVESLHPAGYHYEFLMQLAFEESMTISEDFYFDATYRYIYDSKYLYDGSITYGGQIIISDTEIVELPEYFMDNTVATFQDGETIYFN